MRCEKSSVVPRKSSTVESRSAQSSNLTEFLEQCHELHTFIDVVTDKSLTTQGDITNPDSCQYTKRILPWEVFDASQAEVWARIGDDSEIATRYCFPSGDSFQMRRKERAGGAVMSWQPH